jgi:hypothetical protein
MEVSGQIHVPAALLAEDTASGTHCIGGWVSLRTGVDDVKYRRVCCPPPEIEPLLSFLAGLTLLS